MRMTLFAPIAALAFAAIAAPAVAQDAPTITLNGARVAAVDTEALARFYEDAFGMVEVQRIPLQPAPEIMLNFGADTAAAIANPNGDIIVFPVEANEDDAYAAIVFDVSDAASVAADVVAAGGAVVRAPFAYGDTGMMIGMVVDPAGNQIELIQWPVTE